MRLTPKFANLMLALAAFAVAQLGFAGPRTLIEMNGGAPSAGLASSWKKIADGNYEFVLDTTKDIGGGQTVTPDAVKSSLESKLGSSYGVKVTAKDASTVDVAYTGDENTFLTEVSKAKIRAGGKDVELALESSVSDGGIRAKKADRPAAPGEVKAMFLRSEGGVIVAMVNESKSTKVKPGDKVKIKGEVKGAKKNDMVFFKPDKMNGDTWVPVAGSLQ
jgi:hypothetical protein